MDLCANRTVESLVSVIFALGRIVIDPALHVQACIRAAENKRRHPIGRVDKSGQDRSRIGA
jgi:hypothetical protein